jgi:hypothetical protein
MVQQENCQNCHQKHDCQEVYRRLGNSTCPSVVIKTIVAFLLPLVVFIVSLVVFNRIYSTNGGSGPLFSQDGNPVDAPKLQIAVGFLAALLVTCVCVFVTRIINKKCHSI